MAALLVAGMSRRNHVNALARLRTTTRCDDFGVSKTNNVRLRIITRMRPEHNSVYCADFLALCLNGVL
jgi:hypothetical protein